SLLTRATGPVRATRACGQSHGDAHPDPGRERPEIPQRFHLLPLAVPTVVPSAQSDRTGTPCPRKGPLGHTRCVDAGAEVAHGAGPHDDRPWRPAAAAPVGAHRRRLALGLWVAVVVILVVGACGADD